MKLGDAARRRMILRTFLTGSLVGLVVAGVYVGVICRFFKFAQDDIFKTAMIFWACAVGTPGLRVSITLFLCSIESMEEATSKIEKRAVEDIADRI